MYQYTCSVCDESLTASAPDQSSDEFSFVLWEHAMFHALDGEVLTENGLPFMLKWVDE